MKEEQLPSRPFWDVDLLQECNSEKQRATRPRLQRGWRLLDDAMENPQVSVAAEAHLAPIPE